MCGVEIFYDFILFVVISNVQKHKVCTLIIIRKFVGVYNNLVSRKKS